MSSKEKNIEKVEPTTKKESVSVLERIRRRTGLLVGIVGLALVIFILESLLGSGASLFGGSELTTVGSINGKKVDRNEFASRVELQLNNYRQQNQGREADDATRGQAIESAWNQYVIDLAIVPQFNKIGIDVSEDELYENVVTKPAQTVIQFLTDPNTGKISSQIATPDGNIDLVKWKQVVANQQDEQFVKSLQQMEDQVKRTRLFEKFRTVVNKGLYVTKAEAKELYASQNTRLDISYVIKRYDGMLDKDVKLTDDDIQKYYNDNTFKFMNKETTRSVEFVAFNIVPSPEDMTALEGQAKLIAEELKGKPASEDSLIMGRENDGGIINIQNYTRKTMILRDSSVYTSPEGTVFGPYNEGAVFKVYKLEKINYIADSARVRHILVGLSDPKTNQPKRDKARAKKEADSLIVLLKDKKISFDSLVVNYSDDMGSKTNGGDYGWFDENEQFVEPFKNAGLMGVKGNITAVETQFGYHIIEVLDVSKSKHTSYSLAQVSKNIAASDQTSQKIFAQANQFGGENNTGELFDKAVDAQKLTKRLAQDFKEGDRLLAGGLDRARELVKWAYAAKVGDVSVFSFDDKYVVAKLSNIKNKGVLPLEIVKDEVVRLATLQKKAEMFKEEFKNKAGNSKNIDEIASKMGLESKKQENLILESHNVEGIGSEDGLIGTAAGIKTGQVSKPTSGNNGVFVVSVNKVIPAPDNFDFKNQQLQMEREISGRTDYEAFNAIKELSEIEDHKSRID
ncbi:MAG: SurA N-terminal domain-containing protein [Bacteroidia bacterium]|nr:SurA N-terminal domain-containing protein [Bacteroidia bacterium]